ncbi:DUF4349 domain-containing protein [Compostimonas suwonensis]|uniref:Uncharacterized protein DUF4349 n=1 Tax=Compostimonas suwonensis TaxID=1048394 RepID=A0A2M9BVW3_9MICO|nr:DUF4349 domain-containing protein [Compostimonas suwonensis]PJJ62075.1 uncharacterized protein DUF4349 [Compostimonas suwonensis]
MRRLLGTGVAVILAVSLLSACTAGGSSSVAPADNGAGLSEPIPAPGLPGGIVGGVPGADGGAADGSAGSSPERGLAEDAAAAASDRQVISTGTLSLTVDGPVDAASRVVSIVESAGGRVDERSEQPETESQRASARLTVRIPADELDAALSDIEDLGEVNSLTVNASDVTTQVSDVDARIAALQTSVDRLLALLAQATTTSDLISLESALSERQGELDSLKSQRDYLSDQVAMSTIYVELFSEGVVAESGPDDFWSGLVAGWNSLLAAGSGFLVVLGVLLPWLVLLAIVALVVVVIVFVARSGRRRGRGGPHGPSSTPHGAPTPPGAPAAPSASSSAPSASSPTPPGASSASSASSDASSASSPTSPGAPGPTIPTVDPIIAPPPASAPTPASPPAPSSTSAPGSAPASATPAPTPASASPAPPATQNDGESHR